MSPEACRKKLMPTAAMSMWQMVREGRRKSSSQGLVEEAVHVALAEAAVMVAASMMSARRSCALPLE